MIAYNSKGPLIFYDLDELNPIDAVPRTKRNPLDKAKGKKGGNITQEAYVKLILPHVQRRMEELERQGKHMIFQKDNDNGHGSRSQDNPARLAKCAMNLNYVNN